ncbi:hypothetical protein [Novacetimonas pomaceti]|uniref:hypothetical protein n=1 Tax=Novacetimonas pomaceti TaxID=2021998 RepID=UPI0010581B45|nr:hypothetical protein [Novacetimonas pomaceti]
MQRTGRPILARGGYVASHACPARAADVGRAGVHSPFPRRNRRDARHAASVGGATAGDVSIAPAGLSP